MNVVNWEKNKRDSGGRRIVAGDGWWLAMSHGWRRVMAGDGSWLVMGHGW